MVGSRVVYDHHAKSLRNLKKSGTAGPAELKLYIEDTNLFRCCPLNRLHIQPSQSIADEAQGDCPQTRHPTCYNKVHSEHTASSRYLDNVADTGAGFVPSREVSLSFGGFCCILVQVTSSGSQSILTITSFTYTHFLRRQKHWPLCTRSSATPLRQCVTPQSLPGICEVLLQQWCIVRRLSL